MENDTKIDFLRIKINKDIEDGLNAGRIHTRFPPEPNGYLHIGHAKAILINYEIAQEYKGEFNLRFDDTNPEKESTEYVKAIKEDLEWLGCDWENRIFFTSDYFEQLYKYAVTLIEKGLAYVCELNSEETRKYRGSITEPGKNSPFRDRSIEENLDLFQKMRNGEFNDGEKVLKAKIDMASPNLHLRDPVIYRITKTDHHRTGNKWTIYPMYDFAHGLSDAIEKITHSLCTLEFEIHRPLYDWFLDALDFPTNNRPHQTEFARLNLSFTIMSKRKLLKLVEENIVDGWDDPRMPTISGMRKRGYPAEVIKDFCRMIGITKFNGITDIALLEHCLRTSLNTQTPRALAVLNPLKVIITNYPENKEEELDAVNNPTDENSGTRKIPFSRELYIEQSDFMEDAPKKFFRLSEGREVRFKYAYLITCNEVIKDDNGIVIELHCTYDTESRGGKSPDGRKVKGTIHWVSAKHAVKTEVRLYDRLFLCENPDNTKDGKDFLSNINPDSLEIIQNAYVEPGLVQTKTKKVYQFERTGYFIEDENSTPEKPIFNRTVTLRDSWKNK